VPPRASKCAAPASDSSPETPAGAIRASGGTKGRARARPPPPPGPPLTGRLRAASSADLSEFRRGSLNEKSLPVKLRVPHLASNLHTVPGARTHDDDAMPTTVKDAIKAFEAAKECVAAEAEKVRARDAHASPRPRASSHRTVHTLSSRLVSRGRLTPHTPSRARASRSCCTRRSPPSRRWTRAWRRSRRAST
jgi:hypothetical protein